MLQTMIFNFFLILPLYCKSESTYPPPCLNIQSTFITNGVSHHTKGYLQPGDRAPEFKGQAAVLKNGDVTDMDIKLSDYLGKYVVFFFYPQDFTFVCPTEIIAFSERAEEFKKINCEVYY